MIDQKIKPSNQSVSEFLNKISPEDRRRDCFELLTLMERVADEKAIMWGESIVGFGSYHYKYDTGREGEWILTGFSPTKQGLTIYITTGFDNFKDYLKVLGKYKTSVNCLYINKIEDVDKKTLSKLIKESVRQMKKSIKYSKV